MRAWIILGVCACGQSTPILIDAPALPPDAPACGPVFRIDGQACASDGLVGMNLEGTWTVTGMQTTQAMPVAQPLSFTLTILPTSDQESDGVCIGISGGPVPAGEWDEDGTSASRGVTVSATVDTEWAICADDTGMLVIDGFTRDTGGQSLETFSGTLAR